MDLFSENFVNYVNGRPMEHSLEPLTGRFPIPVIGPLPLLKESRLNHIGESPTSRHTQTAGGFPIKEQLELFPKKPAKKMS